VESRRLSARASSSTSAWLFRRGNWQTIIVRPGTDPIVELAGALSSDFDLSRSEILSTLRRSSLGLAEFAREHLRPSHLLIVIDQFEELIRYRNEASERGGREESAAFVKLLLAATGHSELPHPNPPISIFMLSSRSGRNSLASVHNSAACRKL